MQNKLHYAIAEFVPVTFIEDSSFMHSKIEEESQICANTLVFSKYIKPAHLRSPNQKVAHVTLSFKDRHSANTAIQCGLFIEGKHVDVRKKLTEPRRCLKCQKFGHFVIDCKTDGDTCARCSGWHRTSACKMTSIEALQCSNCVGDKASGHGATDRNCPAFKSETNKIHDRTPDNKYRYFPTSTPSTWVLLNEPDSPAEPRPHTHSEGRQTTPQGRTFTPLTQQDRHYVPRPRTDTYIPDKGWPSQRPQTTLDAYVKGTQGGSQTRPATSNTAQDQTDQVSKAGTPRSSEPPPTLEYA